ncbi:MAG: Na+/H+ antiporter subunit E [Desulfobacterota bacterium]|nr:Na+/H+ antiporter subunit E [Thermodesulfobacteriota bacterium]MDW8002136.1 Na+/H+ antiporter subunit E [Deltaproteobacteria bacterium]
MARSLATILLLFGFWISLSGLVDLYHLGLGILSVLIVFYISGDLFLKEKPGKKKAKEFVRFINYIPYLLYSIFLANIEIIKLALHPKMMDLISPHIVRFRSKLKEDLPIVTFANSITLTPGTITVKIEENVLYVHAIDIKASGQLPGELEEKVAGIFKD